MKSGEVDFAQMTPTQVKDVKDLANYILTLVQQNSWQHFDMSIKTDRGARIFGDKNVRTALFMLIDKKTIVDGVLEGTVQVADTVAPTTSPYYNPNVKKYAYEAYPSWASSHPDKSCPEKLEQLNEYMNNKDIKDPWGFEYKTTVVWVKDKIGLGYFVRNQHELLLVATRGDMPSPSPANRPASVISAPRREHSRKPDEAYAHDALSMAPPTHA